MEATGEIAMRNVVVPGFNHEEGQMCSSLCLTFRGPGMGFVVLGLQLEQGTWQLLQGPICQPKALEDRVARHADDA